MLPLLLPWHLLRPRRHHALFGASHSSSRPSGDQLLLLLLLELLLLVAVAWGRRKKAWGLKLLQVLHLRHAELLLVLRCDKRVRRFLRHSPRKGCSPVPATIERAHLLQLPTGLETASSEHRRGSRRAK